jgi:chromosome segregation ATPase
MVDTARLKNLVEILRPLTELVPVLERVENAEQSIRSAEAQAAKIKEKSDAILARADRLDAELIARNASIAKREEAAEKACEDLKAIAAKEVAAIKQEAEEYDDRLRKSADVLLANAEAEAKSIGLRIADKRKEADALDARIAKAKEQLKRMLGAAE